ncbi:arylamine N-acetyltransferase, partial [Bacillus wiedmannii]
MSRRKFCKKKGECFMMTKLQKEFFKRLKIPPEEVTFDDLDE